MRLNIKKILTVLIFGILSIYLFMSLTNSSSLSQTIPYKDLTSFVHLAVRDFISQIEIHVSTHEVFGILKAGGKICTHTTNVDFIANIAVNKQIPCIVHPANSGIMSLVVKTILAIFQNLVFFYLIFSMNNRVSSKNNEIERPTLKFVDVIGMENEKKEIMEIVDMTRHPNLYRQLKCKTLKGIALFGPPGNGKTYLARALAGEINAAFFAASAAEFIEIYVGTGPKRIRQLFESAKQHPLSIIFIDEADSLGRRSDDNRGGNSEYNNTINELLTQMDGITENNNIIVIFATNRLDAMDKALLRTGRIDRFVEIGNPDCPERKLLLEYYLENVPLDSSVKTDRIAANLIGSSRSDIATLVNESKLLAIRQHRPYLLPEDFEEAKDRAWFGLKGKTIMSPQEMRLTAIHESAHAYMMFFFRECVDPIYKATILPRGPYLGAVMPNIQERVSVSKKHLEARIMISLAGQISEEIFFGKEMVTTGCSGDLRNVRQRAEEYVLSGFSEDFGFSTISSNSHLLSEQEKAKLTSTVQKVIGKLRARAKLILEANQYQILKLADALLQAEMLTGEEIVNILLDRIPVPALATTQKSIIMEAPSTIE